MSNTSAKRQGTTGDLVETVYGRMSELLGTPIKSEADAVRVTKGGIPARRFKFLMKRLRLTPDAIGSETTIRRRLQQVEQAVRSKEARRAASDVRKSQLINRARAGDEVAVSAEPRLNQAESERLMRLTRVVSEATQLFGDEQRALDWLNTADDFLHDDKPVTPMKLAETDAGARMVESMIRRTAYGLF